MRFLQTLTVLCTLALTLAAHAADKVRIVVRVPVGTPSSEPIYLSGASPSLGSWKAAGVKLHREENGTYAADFDWNVGDRFEFKVTRGSWETVEKAKDGNDRPNRFIEITPDTKVITVDVESWGAGGVSTVAGAVKLHTIDSKHLKGSRTIRVWVPAEYEKNPDARYPVLYMHDGQNCFDKGTAAFGHEWQLDETLAALIKSRDIEPWIAVAIDHGPDRIGEYTYQPDPTHAGGRGAEYATFVLEEAIPFINQTYRTKTGPQHTAIGGASLGGIISLEIARRHPGTFGAVLAMSPALHGTWSALIDELERDPAGLAGTRVYIDMGTRERELSAMGEPVTPANQPLIDAAARLAAALESAKVTTKAVIEDGGEHNETAWARRLPAALRFLLAK